MEDKVIIKKDEKQVTLDNMIDVSEKIVLGHPIGSEEIERKMAKVQTAEAVKATALTPETAAKNGRPARRGVRVSTGRTINGFGAANGQ